MDSAIARRADRVAELAHDDELARSALAFAAFAFPGLDVAHYYDRLVALAVAVEGSDHLALRRVISIAEGIGGNVEDYYAPENSFLNRVLDSRRGIPVSLAVLWIEVGRLAGIETFGVGLPGHFVVSVDGQLVDPFHYGEAIGFEEAGALVAGALGGTPRLDPGWLSPVPSTEIIARMLRNLDAVFQARGDPASRVWVRTCLQAL